MIQFPPYLSAAWRSGICLQHGSFFNTCYSTLWCPIIGCQLSLLDRVCQSKIIFNLLMPDADLFFGQLDSGSQASDPRPGLSGRLDSGSQASDPRPGPSGRLDSGSQALDPRPGPSTDVSTPCGAPPSAKAEWQITELSTPNQPPARTIPKMAHRNANYSFRDTWYKRHPWLNYCPTR